MVIMSSHMELNQSKDVAGQEIRICHIIITYTNTESLFNGTKKAILVTYTLCKLQ